MPPELHGQRLDRMLVAGVPEFSRSYLQQLLEDGAVSQMGLKQAKSSLKVKAGEVWTIELRATPQSQAFKPEKMPLHVVYEDAHLRVIDKPAGLVVHPAPGNWSGTLMNGLLGLDPQLTDVAMSDRPWTSSKQKTVDLPIGRDPANRLRMAVVDLTRHSGKIAKTHFHVLSQNEQGSLVRCILETGRTHQIRVHMASLKLPLVGDTLYGGSIHALMPRQALHAERLSFDHPMTGQAMDFLSPLPADFQSLRQAWSLSYNENA